MNKILTIILMVSFFPVFCHALENDPVKEKYTQKLDLAKKKYLAAIEDIRKQMLAEYEKYLASAMKSKNIEKANEIKQRIDALKASEKQAGVSGVDETNNKLEFGVPNQPK